MDMNDSNVPIFLNNIDCVNPTNYLKYGSSIFVAIYMYIERYRARQDHFGK